MEDILNTIHYTFSPKEFKLRKFSYIYTLNYFSGNVSINICTKKHDKPQTYDLGQFNKLCSKSNYRA
jgi:hypothetical protein